MHIYRSINGSILVAYSLPPSLQAYLAIFMLLSMSQETFVEKRKSRLTTQQAIVCQSKVYVSCVCVSCVCVCVSRMCVFVCVIYACEGVSSGS